MFAITPNFPFWAFLVRNGYAALDVHLDFAIYRPKNSRIKYFVLRIRELDALFCAPTEREDTTGAIPDEIRAMVEVYFSEKYNIEAGLQAPDSTGFEV